MTTRLHPLHIILNPIAGGGASRVRAEIERELRARALEFRIETTRARGHASDLAAEAAAAGAPVVVAAGGDGTIHEVANGILQAGSSGEAPAFAIIPLGTGNDFVKILDAGTRTAMYDALAAGTVRPADVGRANWAGSTEYFVNSAGTGIDVEAVRQMQRSPGAPRAVAYLLGLARALAVYRPAPLRITVDGRAFPARAVMMAAVSNGRCVGGSFRLSPSAEIDDGLLDLCCVDALGTLRSLRLTARILRGTHEQHDAVTRLRGHTFVFEVDAPRLPFQLDGELRESLDGTVRIDVLTHALRVIAPVAMTPGGQEPSSRARAARAGD